MDLIREQQITWTTAKDVVSFKMLLSRGEEHPIWDRNARRLAWEGKGAGANHEFWSHLGCSRRNANVLAVMVSFRVQLEKNTILVV